jgi:SOS-response transcriptional repressor LexA
MTRERRGMLKPTSLQINVLEFIRGYFEGSSRPPTVREIQTGLEIKNIGTVQRALKALETKRFIERRKNTARNIIILQI